jgi:hypothetical protein
MLWRVPSMDDIFLENSPLHHNSKTQLQKKATEKWYRTVYFNNLTERPAWRNSGFLAAGFRIVAIAAQPRQKKNAPGEAGGALKKLRNERRKLTLVTVWPRAAETPLVLARSASPAWLPQP